MKLHLVLVCLVLAVLPATAGEGYGPLIRNGLDEDLAIGADLFFSETFEGNGRTCGTCHLATENYGLPADLSTVPFNAPLMIGDPDNPNFVNELELCDQSSGSEDCAAIGVNGLILENVDGANLGPDFSRSYSMRSVPHLLSLATSIEAPPASIGDAVGWSSDGAPGNGTLRDFATGAVRQHFTLDTARVAGVHFREPNDDELDAILAFQLALGRLNEIDLASVTFLDANAIEGRLLFNEDPVANQGTRCARCHVNAGAKADSGFNENFDTHIEENRFAPCPNGNPGQCAEESAALVAGGNRDGGHGLAAHPSADGRWGDGTFNPPPLIEAADTGPFFHDNRNLTLEAAIEFYRQPDFLASPACAGVDLCGLIVDENPQPFGNERFFGAMLRILNAGLNVSMAVQRLNATLGLMNTEPGDDPSVIKELTLARAELQDAKDVLRATFGNVPVFDPNDPELDVFNARTQLAGYITTLDGMIDNGAGGLALAVLLTQVIATSENHLSPDFYDETSATCSARGVSVSAGQYHDCRWIYDLGKANTIYDNSGVEPSIDTAQTSFTWTTNPGGTATLEIYWITDEWTNPLFESTKLTDLSPSPAFSPITYTTVTALPNGKYERSYSHTVPCIKNRKYRMELTTRVGGVTESDVRTIKAAPFCLP